MPERAGHDACGSQGDIGWTPAAEGLMAKTVMIVEDNELNMKLFHDLLEAHGYETVGTRNGIEALDLARSTVRLILMDIQLPKSPVSKSQVAQGGRRASAIPVVAVTALR